VEQKEISDRISEYLSQNKIGGDSFEVKNPRYFLTGIGQKSLQEKREDRKVIATASLKAFEKYEKKSGKSFFESLFGIDDETKSKLKEEIRRRRGRRRGGRGSPYNKGEFTGKAADIPPEGKALLDAIAGSESRGYNSRYPSKTFDNGWVDHPRLSERILSGPNKGKRSDAAGRYQFLSTTWDQYKPAKEFTPENQDIAAYNLAIAAYGYGESGLLKDLREDPLKVANKLSGTWTSLPGGIERNNATDGFLDRFEKSVKEYNKTKDDKKTPSGGDYDIIIPLDHVPPNMSGKFPDTDARKSFDQSRATGAAGRERDHQDKAASKLKAKLDKKGYKVLILKPESFSSYEAYDKYIKQQSAKGVRILPLHFDAEVSKGGTGFLTRTRKGDAEDAAFAAPIQKALENFQRNNKKLGGISKDTVGNATVNAGAASPTALIELGAMVQWEREYGKNFTGTSKFDELIQSITDAIEKTVPKGGKPVKPKPKRNVRGSKTVEVSSTTSQTQLASAIAMSYDRQPDDAILLMNMQNNTQIPQGKGGESVAKASEKSDNKLNSSLSLYAVGSVA
jgi:muramidase (phage lysozyme)